MTLTAARTALAAALTAAGLPGRAQVDEVVVPPVVVIEPADPWIEASEVPGTTRVHLDLFAIVGPPGTNATALAALETLTAAVLAADLDPWQVVAVSAPYTATVNGYEYLTARIATVAHDQNITTT